MLHAAVPRERGALDSLTRFADTGDRPYMCVLCRDTFSRSDILKRHFQKCSIRRGNPQGVSHLSHPQAHVKKSQSAAKPHDGDVNHMNGMSGMQGDGVHPFGMVSMQDGMNSMANDANQLSRSSSMGRLEDSNSRDRRPMPNGPGYGGDVSSSMQSNINSQLANYNTSGQNGLPMFGGSGSNQQSGSLDWTQMFQPGAQDTRVNNPNHLPNHRHMQIAVKHDPDGPTGSSTAV